MSQIHGNLFLTEELVTLRHYDKKIGQWKESEYPKVGGRLRLAHEHNGTLEISTEIIKYDGNVAIVKAHCTTDKGSYSGIGMASVERDEKIAPAILELAETRSIARSLRFAGYGIEYCSAEEVSHLNNGNDQRLSSPPVENHPFSSRADNGGAISEGGGGSNNNDSSGDIGSSKHHSTTHHGSNGSGNNTSTNDNGRLSNKQYNYLLTLGTNHGFTRKEMDQKAITMFGTALSYLNKSDASSMIDEMRSSH